MLNFELALYAGWSAIVSAMATVVGFVTLIIFFSVGQPWGTINDVASVILAFALLPVLLALYYLQRQNAPVITLGVLVIGGLALLVAAVFQLLLIFGVIKFQQTAVVVSTAFGLFGASLVVYSALARAQGSLPNTLALLGIIAGVGYVLVVVGFILGGQEHPLAAIGGLTAVIIYPIFAIWFGRILLSGLTVPA
jgi:hypothetical protein